jgi:hypothetical protein
LVETQVAAMVFNQVLYRPGKPHGLHRTGAGGCNGRFKESTDLRLDRIRPLDFAFPNSEDLPTERAQFLFVPPVAPLVAG